MIKLTNAKTGEVTYYPEKDERITVEKFKQMTYAEWCDSDGIFHWFIRLDTVGWLC